jgi:hypothetical protein
MKVVTTLGAALALTAGGCGGGDAEPAKKPESAPAAKGGTTPAPADAGRSAPAAKPAEPAGPPAMTKEQIAEVIGKAGADTATIAEWFSGPDFHVFRFRVDGKKSIATWEKLRAQVDTTGYWPVILGDADGASALDENRATVNLKPSIVLAQTTKVDVMQWLDERSKKEAETFQVETAAWPDKFEGAKDFGVVENLRTGEPLEEVHVAMVPVRDGSEAPAYLALGGWGTCPPPTIHVATLRRWHEKWGAELVCLSSNCVELKIAKMPSGRDEGFALAREQFLYCPDRVKEETRSVEKLGAILTKSGVWSFTWN